MESRTTDTGRCGENPWGCERQIPALAGMTINSRLFAVVLSHIHIGIFQTHSLPFALQAYQIIYNLILDGYSSAFKTAFPLNSLILL